MSTDRNTIDSYDENSELWANRMKSKKNIAHEFLEKPAMYSKLPDLQGKSVLCVGCGSGEECDYIKKLGAKRVVGTDIVKGLVEQARYAYPEVEFEVMDMERLEFPEESFDFVYSSLAIHYLEDWRNVLKGVHRTLSPDGIFLFSTHHPMRWGGQKDRVGTRTRVLLGYEMDDSKEYSVYGDYLNTHKLSDVLLKEIKVSYYNRPLSEILRDIRESGFEIADFVEPKPLEGVKADRPDFYAVHNKIPLFMIFELKKK